MAPRPNIILITTDQQRTDTLGSAGSAFAGTPHMDRLAREGVVCERPYTTNPVCTPARVSLFSGEQVSRHGAWNVGVNAPTEIRTIAHRLAESGYRTHNVGKMHFQAFGSAPEQSAESFARWDDPREAFSGPYYGFQTVEFALGHSSYGMRGHYGAWVREQVDAEEFARFARPTRLSQRSFGGEAYDWELPTRLHNSVWTTDRAIDFLRHRDPEQPFFLSVGFEDPHHPHCLPTDFTERPTPDEMPTPDFVPGELDDKPPHFNVARRGELETSAFRGEYHIAGQGGGADYRNVSPEDAQMGKAYYQGMVRLIDREVGRLLNFLDEADLAENTIVIFTSDHGELLGDHGLWMKGPFPYEQIVRVPLLVRWPNGIPAGQRTAALLSHLDIVPTLLAAVGLPAEPELDGFDALPLLRGEVGGIRDGVMVECIDDPRRLRLKTYITETRKLTWYAGAAYGELYDLAQDPGEKVNRWDDPAYASDKSDLLARLLSRLEPLERREPRDCYA
jgi:arylsulfatase A-like enzyme